MTFDDPIGLTDDIFEREIEPLLSCLYGTREAAEKAKENRSCDYRT